MSPRRSILFTYAMHKLSYVHVRTHLADLQDYIQNQIWRTMKQNRILQKTKWIFIWYLYVWTRYISFNDYKYLEYIPCLRQWMELHELISKLLSLSYNEVKLLSRNVASSLVKSLTFLLLPWADLAIVCIMCPGFPLQGIQTKLQLVINMKTIWLKCLYCNLIGLQWILRKMTSYFCRQHYFFMIVFVCCHE